LTGGASAPHARAAARLDRSFLGPPPSSLARSDATAGVGLAGEWAMATPPHAFAEDTTRQPAPGARRDRVPVRRRRLLRAADEGQVRGAQHGPIQEAALTLGLVKKAIVDAKLKKTDIDKIVARWQQHQVPQGASSGSWCAPPPSWTRQYAPGRGGAARRG